MNIALTGSRIQLSFLPYGALGSRRDETLTLQILSWILRRIMIK